MKIYKYKLELQEIQFVRLPAYFKILTVQLQGDSPTMWVLVDTEKPLVSQRILMTGTGQDNEIGFNDTHIGTIQQRGFVWHFFHSHN